MQYYRKISLYLLAALLGLAIATPAQAQSFGDCDQAIGEAFLDINQVRAKILNNGNLFWNGGNNVYEVPKGGANNALFASGIWLGGQVDGQLRLAGSTYGPYEFWPGPLNDDGSPIADCNPFDRVWKVSKEEVISYEGSGVATPDLQDWPTGLGAPTIDANGDPIDLTDQPLNSRINRKINLGAGERPAILGDQMLWWINNDRGNAHLRTDSPPMGVEVHGTAFAFNTSGAIGNMTFYKYRIFYKGTVPLTDAYMGIFSDPDLGAAFDDYVGSDSTLGLGYVYNADNDDDNQYGTPPPATGYDFFQGPLVDSDGLDNDGDGEIDEEEERLKMTAFVFYNNGGGVQGDPGDGQDMYNYMQGRWLDGQRITVGGNGRNFSNIPTNFMFPGNPPEFWSEFDSDGAGSAIAPADRRFVMATGPFTIQPQDEQEIVYGIVWSRGDDNIDSVTKMKQEDALAQAVFDIDFQLPPPPAAPRVTTTVADKAVILEWEYNPTDNNFLESYSEIDPLLSPDVDDRDYLFEGYNVYQYATADDQTGDLIAVFDVINGVTRVIEGVGLTFVTAEGTDSGLARSFTVTGLTNYQTYYFGVQAYAYNQPSSQKVYAGPIARLEVVPTRINALNDGTVLSEEATGAIALQRVTQDQYFRVDCSGGTAENPCRPVTKDGIGGGEVAVEVVNPAVIQDAEYRVEFIGVEVEEEHKVSTVSREIDADTPELLAKSAAATVTSYNIFRGSEQIFNGEQAVAVTGHGAPQSLDGSVLQIDGLAFWIAGPAPGPLYYEDDPANGYVKMEVVGTGGSDPCGPDALSTYGCAEAGGNNINHSLSSNAATQYVGNNQGTGSDGTLSAYAPNDFEIRFNAEGSYSFSAFQEQEVSWIPVQVWDIGAVGTFGTNDPADDVQMVIVTFHDADDLRCNWIYSEEYTEGFGAHATSRIYGYHVEGSDFASYADWEAAVKPLVDADDDNCVESPGEPRAGGRAIQREVFGDWTDNFIGQTPPLEGAVVRFLTTKPNLPGDTFTFSTAGLGASKNDIEMARQTLDQIGVSPNPYKGASAYEVSQLTDQVRFTNMPHQATIRIFSLNGSLIKTLIKNSPEATLPWDLTTEEGLPIASGMYIIHVDAKTADGTAIGEKVIKFAAIKKRVQLNTF